jgi:hypothetical protein
MSFVQKVASLFQNDSQSNANTGESQSSDRYPVYQCRPPFFQSITFECCHCGREIYEREQDDGLVCGYCGHDCQMTEDDFPEAIRARCRNCGEISDAVGGPRLENLSFDCPHCGFHWESSPY